MLNNFRFWILVFALASGSLLGATASASQLPPFPEISQGAEPVWVSDPRLQFRRTDFLSRRGRGATAEEAVHAAYDKILQLYRVPEGGALPSEIEEALTVAGIWHDGANNEYRAIITLKQKAAENYPRAQIRTLDKTTRELLTRAKSEQEPIVKLGLVAKAEQLQNERAAWQKSMKKIDVTGQGIRAKWKVKTLNEEIDQIITKLAIQPAGDASDVSPDVMASMITRGLKVAGISAASAEKADYILKGRLAISHAPDESGWMGGLGTLEVELFKKGEEQPIGSYQWDINVLHLYPETAERRVVEKAEYLLKKEMRDVLITIALTRI